MIIHRRIQSAIYDARQKYYYARIAVIAKASLRSDPSQYAQPVLARLQEVAPVVDLEGGTTKKVYRQTVRVFEDAVAHLKSLPIAAEVRPSGPELLPVPSRSGNCEGGAPP